VNKMVGLYIVLLLLLIVACTLMAIPAHPATRKSDADVLVREHLDGSWEMYLFGPPCPGKLIFKQPEDRDDPMKVICTR